MNVQEQKNNQQMKFSVNGWFINVVFDFYMLSTHRADPELENSLNLWRWLSKSKFPTTSLEKMILLLQLNLGKHIRFSALMIQSWRTQLQSSGVKIDYAPKEEDFMESINRKFSSIDITSSSFLLLYAPNSIWRRKSNSFAKVEQKCLTKINRS